VLVPPIRILSLPQVSKCIGNQKPLILLEVEVIAWKALFAVARGEIDADAAFVHVMNTIPWEKLPADGSLERYWFRPGMFYLFIFPNSFAEVLGLSQPPPKCLARK
jgi:hypothetical protein